MWLVLARNAEPATSQPKQLAHELGVSTSAINRSVERGELPAIRLLPRGSIHIPRSALDAKRQASP
jgi:excisionase family DNA binding protein